MKPETFIKFKKLAYVQAGIDIKDGKEAMVTARVAKRIRSLQLKTEEDYISYLESDNSNNEIINFLDVISTNFTSFFREAEHFEILSNEIKKLVNNGQRRLRIWCAASSTGEEPYTIAITILNAIESIPVDIKILATDISTRALAAAKAGHYSEETMQNVPEKFKLKYFDKHINEFDKEVYYSVKQKLKDMVVYKRLNLSNPPFPMNGPLDGIFCRNVMIYFDLFVRQKLLNEFERLLGNKRLLMIGHSETLSGIDTPLNLIKPSLYVKINK